MAEFFGKLGDGEPVERVTISKGKLSANILTWGAVVQDMRLEGHAPSLVLGFETFEPYPMHSPYFGAIAGRYANRIANAQFSIDGIAHQTDPNFLGKHTLHGGARGIGKRIWNITDKQPDWVSLSMVDPDGSNGFPGNCSISCTYRITENAGLEVELIASTDAPTLCNLAHHSYFNLDGSSSILDHHLEILAETYIPVDAELIPTGKILPVNATPYDFRVNRRIGSCHQQAFDHNFCLSDKRVDSRKVATVRSRSSGVEMKIFTTEPGLQFYSGAKIDVPVPGLDGLKYGPFAGMALEPQVWPDSPNQPCFPQALLRPGDTYRQLTTYQFTQRGKNVVD